MDFFNVYIEDTGETFRCKPTESLLAGMERLGKKGIPVGCRQGGCGVCKVRVTEGDIHKRVMSRDHVSVEEEADNVLLACRTYPRSDISIEVIGKFRKNVCRPKYQTPVVSPLVYAQASAELVCTP